MLLIPLQLHAKCYYTAAKLPDPILDPEYFNKAGEEASSSHGWSQKLHLRLEELIPNVFE